MKLIYLGFSLLVLGLSGLVFGSWLQDRQTAQDAVKIREAKDAENYSVVVGKINEARTKEDFAAADKLLSELPKKYQDELSRHLKLASIIERFNEAEDWLDRGRALQESLTVSSKGGIHPLAKECVEKAMKIYEEVKNESDRLSEVKGDADYNFSLNYNKGNIYYRYVQLLSTPETAKELFNQTVTFYKQALRHRPNDKDTVINIELLIKNEKEMSGSGSPDTKKSGLLNQARSGVHRHKGF